MPSWTLTDDRGVVHSYRGGMVVLQGLFNGRTTSAYRRRTQCGLMSIGKGGLVEFEKMLDGWGQHDGIVGTEGCRVRYEGNTRRLARGSRLGED